MKLRKMARCCFFACQKQGSLANISCQTLYIYIYIYLKPWGFGISRWSIQKSTKRTHDSPLRSSGSSFGKKNRNSFIDLACSFSSWWFQPSQNGFIFPKKRWNKKNETTSYFLKEKDFNFWHWSLLVFFLENRVFYGNYTGRRASPSLLKGQILYRKMIWLVVEPTHLKNMLVKMASSSPK